MRRISILIALAIVLVATSAMAESIKGRLGITGQFGFIVPNDSKLTSNFAAATNQASDKLKADAAFTFGGGLIFGVTDHWALEAHVLHTPTIDYNNVSDIKVMKVTTTDASLGVQFRNNVANDVTVYLGGGVDVLFNSVKDASGNEGDIDTVVGGHANAGVDYFLTRYLALNIDIRGVLAPEADIKAGGIPVAKYDPTGYTGLVGLRWFIY